MTKILLQASTLVLVVRNPLDQYLAYCSRINYEVRENAILTVAYWFSFHLLFVPEQIGDSASPNLFVFPCMQIYTF